MKKTFSYKYPGELVLELVDDELSLHTLEADEYGSYEYEDSVPADLVCSICKDEGMEITMQEAVKILKAVFDEISIDEFPINWKRYTPHPIYDAVLEKIDEMTEEN